jgi:hypothetical protein
MTSSGRSLEARLRGIYAGLDAAPGFDERLMARLRVEGDDEAAARTARARAEESRRYALTKHSESWAGWFRRVATLDGMGVAALAVFLVRALWTGSAEQADFIAMHAAQAATVLGLLLALAALPVLLLHRRRRSPDLA